MKRSLIFLALLVAAASPPAAAQKVQRYAAGLVAPPVIRSIAGNPLTIRVGDDTSFQIYNAAVPGNGQIFPSLCALPTFTADMGVFVRRAGALFAPNFAEHPCQSATLIGPNTAWTPVSISQVTGTGTAVDPFQVVVVVDAGSVGLRLAMTVRYVNGQNYFTKILSFSSPTATTFDVFLGSDIYLASSDFGVPFYDAISGSVGGRTCPGQAPYTILHIPLTPAQRYCGRTFSRVWTEIGSGTLSNIADTVCEDNGAALQWQNVSVSPSGTAVIQAATSFGTIPTITQFRIDSVTPNQGQPGQNLTVTITGLGFQSGTTFNFGPGITAVTTATSSTQATVALSIASNATVGPRDVTGTQSAGGLTHTLTSGFQVIVPCTVPAAPVNPRITPLGNPSGPVTGIDFLSLSWSPPASGTTPSSYDWRINGDPFSAPTSTTSATAPPRGSNSPITLQVRARACTPEQPGGAADSPTYSPAPPVANFSASGPISAGASVTFTDTSTPQATSWLWLFGDGGFDTRQSVTHTFANRGIYSVVLIASNGAGSSVKTNQQTVQSLRPLQRYVVSTGSFDASDPERQRLSGVRLARTGETWLAISSPEDEAEVIVYLRFLDEEGNLAQERRLSIAPGQDTLYDLAAYGLTGTYSLELVSTRRFTASLVEVAPDEEARGKRERQ